MNQPCRSLTPCYHSLDLNGCKWHWVSEYTCYFPHMIHTHVYNPACCAIGVVISTAYDSMPPDAVAHIISEIEPKGIFTEVKENDIEYRQSPHDAISDIIDGSFAQSQRERKRRII